MGGMPARRTTREPKPDPKVLPRLQVPRKQLEVELDERIAGGEVLLRMPLQSETQLEEAQAAFYSWTEYNGTLLRRSFDQSGPADSYRGSSASVAWPTDFAWQIKHFRDDVGRRIRRLRSLRDQLGLYEEDTGAGRAPVPAPASRIGGTDVFIVHGRDGGTKETVARFLDRLLNRQPIILHEQADGGRTVIEKFEAHAATAAAAVVLLTGDDVGGLGSSPDHLQPRARQNVIFEMGYFIGVLGRERVAILYEPGVEVPSDIAGVLTIQIDPADGWRRLLARELQDAGLEIDASAVLA
jgi:predicted nucleotide-binding protein